MMSQFGKGMSKEKKSCDDGDDICIDGAEPSSVSKIILATATSNLPQKEISHVVTLTDSDIFSPTVASVKNDVSLKDKRLIALKNMNLLLFEKEREISALKEKLKTYADALMTSELRHSQLLSLVVKLTKQTESHGSAGTGNQSTIAKTCSEQDNKGEADIKVSNKISKTSKTETDLHDKLDEASNGVDEWCQGLKLLETTGVETDEDALRKTQIFTGETSQKTDCVTESLHGKVSMEFPGDFTDPGSDGMQAEVNNLRSKEVPVSFISSKFSGVSRDLVDKLMQQNARLKQMLRQVLNSRGLTVEDYLSREENACVIEQLRQEIRLLQSREKDKDKLLESVVSSDQSGLVAKNLKLEETVLWQNRTLIVKQVMIDALSKRCEELNEEIKHLKVAMTADARPNKIIMVQEKLLSSEELTNRRENSAQRLQSDLLPLPSVGLSADSEEGQSQGFCTDDTGGLQLSRSSISDKNSAVNKCSPLTCKRCERDFMESEREKFLEHLEKCVDD